MSAETRMDSMREEEEGGGRRRKEEIRETLQVRCFEGRARLRGFGGGTVIVW